MRLIDADELREALTNGYGAAVSGVVGLIDAAPTVDVPQPLTRDGVLAEVKAIEDAGGKAIVERLNSRRGEWGITHRDDVKRWINPDVPRWNVRVRAVEVETEDVPLTQLVGRTIKGETEAVARWHFAGYVNIVWRWYDGHNWHDFPDGTLDLDTGLVTVLKGEA